MIRLKYILLVFLLIGCATKKKAIKKVSTVVSNDVTETTNTNTYTITEDVLKTIEIQLIPKDSTKPVIINDIKIENAKEIKLRRTHQETKTEIQEQEQKELKDQTTTKTEVKTVKKEKKRTKLGFIIFIIIALVCFFIYKKYKNYLFN